MKIIHECVTCGADLGDTYFMRHDHKDGEQCIVFLVKKCHCQTHEKIVVPKQYGEVPE